MLVLQQWEGNNTLPMAPGALWDLHHPCRLLGHQPHPCEGGFGSHRWDVAEFSSRACPCPATSSCMHGFTRVFNSNPKQRQLLHGWEKWTVRGSLLPLLIKKKKKSLWIFSWIWILSRPVVGTLILISYVFIWNSTPSWKGVYLNIGGKGI